MKKGVKEETKEQTTPASVGGPKGFFKERVSMVNLATVSYLIVVVVVGIGYCTVQESKD